MGPKMSILGLLSLQMSHFRSHKVMRFECEGGPVAIYGPNGAGKTNILEAVSLFSPGRGLRRASAEDMTRRPEALGWKVSGVLQSLNQTHEVDIWSENLAPRQVKIDGKSTSQLKLGQIGRVLWLIPSMDRLWIEGAEGRRRFLDRMTLSFEPSHAEACLSYEKSMRERNRLLKDQVQDPAWYRAVEQQMANSGTEIDRNRKQALDYVTNAQSQATTSFPTARLELTHADGVVLPDSVEDYAQALRESRSRDLMVGRTLIGPHRADLMGTYTDKDVPAKDCSTGEQKALLVSLILANGRALIDSFGAPPMLLLDEVGAHLDADRRAALYDEIFDLGAQAWMTGTGSELFTSMGHRATYLKVTDDAGISQVSLGRIE